MEEIKEKVKKESFTIEILDLVRTILICFIVVFLCTQFLFKPVRVDGKSMYPTLEDKEYGFSNVLSVLMNDFHRFDVVVVNYAPTDTQWVKRIIGLPNETIEYRDNKLYINGKYMKEAFFDKKYVASQTQNGEYPFTENFGPIVLKEDEYFLMGDNRQVSFDSRRVGPFLGKDIISKSVFVYYPFDKIGIVSDGTK